MRQYSAIAILVVVLMALAFSGCAVQPLQAPEAQVSPEEAIDFDLNPELKFLVRTTDAELAASDLSATNFATGADIVVGEWICEQEDGPQMIRLEPDGRIVRVLGAGDAIDIGAFWFSDGEFHVVSDVDEAALESVFRVVVETVDEGTYLHFEPCGGNCANACDIEWQNGLRLYES